MTATFYCLFFLSFCLFTSTSAVEHFVFWNTSNPLFKEVQPSVEVAIGDVLKMVCPETNEYLVVYEVGELAFEECMVESNSREVLRCGPMNNQEKRKQTADGPKSVAQMIRSLNPTPHGKEFVPGQPVYYITTSNGKIDGMNLKRRGLCEVQNMRVAVRVHHHHHHHPTAPKADVEQEVVSPKFRQFEKIAESAGIRESQLQEVAKLAAEGKTGTFQNKNTEVTELGTSGNAWDPVPVQIVADLMQNAYNNIELAYQRDEAPDYEIHEDGNAKSYPYSSTTSSQISCLAPLFMLLIVRWF